MAADKDWSPESEQDPLELQREQLKIGKEFLEMARAEKEKQAQREAAVLRVHQGPPVSEYLTADQIKPPSFEEVSAALSKCWEEAKKAVPDAPDHVKVIAFQSLLSTTHRYGF